MTTKIRIIKNRVATISSVTLSAIAITCGVSQAVFAWGPEDRPTYTNNSPADYATFNSITDNVAVGDERNFVRVRELGTDGTYEDELKVEPGKEYEVYIYYHNNAGTDTNVTGYGIAEDTRISSAYPTVLNKDERGMISGIISWNYVDTADDEIKYSKVWDEAYLTSDTDGVVMRYKTGTATIHNGGGLNGSTLSTALFTEKGTLIGFNKLSGVIPGCAEYSGYITYTLVAEKTDSSLKKEVSVDGENWAEEVTVKPGEIVTYFVEFKNTGNTDLTNAILKDIHDEGLTLLSGSTKIFDINNPDGLVIDDILDISGYNFGDANAGSVKRIVYQAQVNNDESLCDKTLSNKITVAYNSEDQKEDSASVLVACEKEPEPEPDKDPNPKPTPTPTPTPEPEKNCKTNPEMEGCQQLPSTGPVEIVMAILIVLGISVGGYYLYRTRRTLKTVKNDVTGKEAESKVDGKASEAEKAEKAEKAEETKKPEEVKKESDKK